MKRLIQATALILGFMLVPSGTADAGNAYVQATIVASDPAQGTIRFVDASGRSQTRPAAGDALASLPRLQMGDSVILTIVEDRAITQVRRATLSQPVVDTTPGVVQPLDSEMTTASAASTVSSMVQTVAYRARKSWPNPFSRLYRQGQDRRP